MCVTDQGDVETRLTIGDTGLVFLISVLGILLAVLLAAYLVDRHDRSTGRSVKHGKDFYIELRRARKTHRERTWGRGPLGRLPKPDRARDRRGRRSN